jgi:hypothetical protein
VAIGGRWLAEIGVFSVSVAVMVAVMSGQG